MQLATTWRRGGLERHINAKPAALAAYLAAASALSWSARDDSVVDGDPEARRRLLDQGVVGRKPLEVEVLSRFRRVLNAKKELLRRGGGATPAASIDSWNELLAEAGHQLIRLRSDYASKLERAFKDTVVEHEIDLNRVCFRYRSDPGEGGESAEWFFRALAAKRAAELRTGRALVGPHRDRLEISWGPVDIGRSASMGERKLFGLILTIARRRVLLEAGRDPILLFDDLDAALDEKHLELAWKLLSGVSQVVITTANPAIRGSSDRARAWVLAQGRIEPL